MPKLQTPYDQQRKKEKQAEMPALMKQQKEFEQSARTTNDPNLKKAFQVKANAIKIKIQSYKQGDPVQDQPVKESTGDTGKQVTMTDVGEPESKNGTGGSELPAFASSIDFANRLKSLLRLSEDGGAAAAPASPAITTSSIGGFTNGQPDAKSYIFAPKMGSMASRKGDIKSDKKKKKKTTEKKFTDFYNQE